ncbi:glycosyltransferase family 4 protein [Gemmatimonas sp. UBA7669]|uniref:glycosyltransferase family 4 protein n=1 Tax=Gemmatimonas sp. UBA7669 TaxID=1946568 RepID=UPI0039C85687
MSPSKLKPNGLLLFHCESNTGYAIRNLELAFARAMRLHLGAGGRIFLGYRSLSGGRSWLLDEHAEEVFEVAYRQSSSAQLADFSRWLCERNIGSCLAFDLPVSASINSALRGGCIQNVVSYWGASISSIYPWLLRPARRLQFLMSKHRPDVFVFESEGMRERGVLGSAIPPKRTVVCPIGVDTERYCPSAETSEYAYNLFGIPRDRSIVFFSGHMEERKGVHVLIDAFQTIVRRGITDAHLLLVGNTESDKSRLDGRIIDPRLRDYITFGGYRSDISEIHKSVSIGVVASTGWDSFTVSSVELASSGIPLIVSDLPGLREAVDPEVTGRLVRPGDTVGLADAITELLHDPQLRRRFGAAARDRTLRRFTETSQVDGLVSALSLAESLGGRGR